MRLSEALHGERIVLRHSPRETEKCRSATWRIRNFPSFEKCRGDARGGPGGLIRYGLAPIYTETYA